VHCVAKVKLRKRLNLYKRGLMIYDLLVNNEQETRTLSGILFLIANYTDGQCKNETKPNY